MKIARSGVGLRDALFEQLELLRDGKIKPEQAKVFAHVSTTLINLVRTQIEYERLLLLGEISNTLSKNGILDSPQDEKSLPPGTSVTTHRIK